MAVLKLNNISFSYRQQHIFNQVSLQFGAGKLIGIVGPNGCGKSTLLKLLARQIQPDTGDILVKGKALHRYSTKSLACEIAFLPQNPISPLGITVEQLLQYGRHPHQSWFNQWGKEDRDSVDAATQLLGLADYLHRPLAELSGGQRQRAWLGMILAQDTDIVLLDEPTSALDIGHQVEVMECISHIASMGKTVVLVIHDLAAAARYCNEVIALRDGAIVANGTAKSVVTETLVAQLFDTHVDILYAPQDDAPVIVPRRKYLHSEPM